jgi:uncharacterized protein (DUF924 family)
LDLWFRSTPTLDLEIQQKFEQDLLELSQLELRSEKLRPKEVLSLVVLLDQFPRNIYRNSPASFQFDLKAVELAKFAINNSMDMQIEDPIHRSFFYVPFEHSEDVADQEECVRLMRKLQQDCSEEDQPFAQYFVKFAQEHLELIKRFGRFPHRNGILGRVNTPQETEYLAGVDSLFGVTVQK